MWKGCEVLKMDSKIINELLEINESYKMPDRLMEILLNDENRKSFLNKISGFYDFSIDDFRDYFQQEQGDRKTLKQDYTPDCLCDLMRELIPQSENILDICSGTGALTISCIKKNENATVYCEELSTRALPILLANLALRGVNGFVKNKDVLSTKTEHTYQLKANGKFSDIKEVDVVEREKYTCIISNPPYSVQWAQKNDGRFDGYELAPKSKADYAFVIDALSRLTDDGKAFFILPQGVLFRGQAEGKIRKQLLLNNVIDAVIGLPENMFMNTGIPVLILVLNKNKSNTDVLFINASNMFVKDGRINKMTKENIQCIADIYRERKTVESVSAVVSADQIQKNEFKLNIPRFVCTYVRKELPPFCEVVKDLIRCEIEARKAQTQVIKMLRDICGDEEYSEAKDKFIEFFSEQDIVGETMMLYLELQNLEKKVEYITKHATKKRVPIFDIATFERAKKGKIYEAGTVYIQCSATDGKVRFLTENKELEAKYGVFIPKNKNICTRFLYYMIEYEIEEFLARYQCGMNINPDIFKYLQVTYYEEYKYRKELAMTLDGIDARSATEKRKMGDFQDFKKIHLNGMFVSTH